MVVAKSPKRRCFPVVPYRPAPRAFEVLAGLPVGDGCGGSMGGVVKSVWRGVAMSCSVMSDEGVPFADVEARNGVRMNALGGDGVLFNSASRWKADLCLSGVGGGGGGSLPTTAT